MHPTAGRFVGDDVRTGMDVYTGEGAYLGSVRRVTLAPSRSSEDVRPAIVAIEVSIARRPWRRVSVPVERVQTVTMERVVLDPEGRVCR